MRDTMRAVLDPARLAAVRATGLLERPGVHNLDRLASLAALLLKAPLALVTIVDETSSYWTSCIGPLADEVPERQTSIEASFCQYVIALGEPLIVGDVRADPRTAANPLINAYGVAAWAGYPLRSQDDQVLGTFCVIDTVVREWSEQDVRVLATLADSASVELALRDAVARATAATAAGQRSQERLALLADVGEVLATAGDAEQAVGQLAARVVPLLGDWCLITVLDDVDGQRRDIGRAHRDPSRLGEVEVYAELHATSDAAPIATAIRTCRPVIVAELDKGLIERSLPDPQSRAALERLEPGAVAVFPLQGRGEPFGAIALVNDRGRGAHTAGELGIAQEVARRAGLSLENSRLLTNQRRIADAMQQSMLGEPPRIAGVQIAVRYRPASEDARVGGDWHDVFQQSDNSTMLVIGDVVGHDLHAIGLMGQVKMMTRSIAYDRAAGPAEVLTRVDRTLGGLQVVTLCTALVVQLAPEPNTAGQLSLRWSSAGHPAPLLLLADGRVELLSERPDALLGLRAGVVRSDHHAVLPLGATLLLVTDGLFERRDVSYDDGLDELRARLRTLRSLPLEALCDAVLTQAAAEQPPDDIALIAVRHESVVG
jgi:GAF domain-containing protein